MLHDVCAEIWNELTGRGWTPGDLAAYMGGDVAKNQLVLDFVFNIEDPRCYVGEETAAQLGIAFNVPPTHFLMLEQAPPSEPLYDIRSVWLRRPDPQGHGIARFGIWAECLVDYEGNGYWVIRGSQERLDLDTSKFATLQDAVEAYERAEVCARGGE